MEGVCASSAVDGAELGPSLRKREFMQRESLPACCPVMLVFKREEETFHQERLPGETPLELSHLPGWAPACGAEGEVSATQKTSGTRLRGPWGPTGCLCESQWFLLFLSLLWKGPAGHVGEWQLRPGSLTLGLRGSHGSQKIF